MTQNSFIYMRGLKHAAYTVFCVADGQKYYYEPQFKVRAPFSSGQQVKRSIIEKLNYNPQNEMWMDAKTKCVMTQNEKQKRNVTDCI